MRSIVDMVEQARLVYQGGEREGEEGLMHSHNVIRACCLHLPLPVATIGFTRRLVRCVRRGHSVAQQSRVFGYV
jgi:hypothetical protein